MKSPKGYTLSNAIMTGVVTPHLGVGCTAGDEDCWTIFKDLYYPIIKEWHGYDPETQVFTKFAHFLSSYRSSLSTYSVSY